MPRCRRLSGFLLVVGMLGSLSTPRSTSAGAASLDVAGTSRGWTIQPTPNPTGTQDNSLAGVSCVTKRACVAVGFSSVTRTGTDVTLAEAWDGRTWRVQPTPNPPGTAQSILSGVSCTSKRSCVAVGNTFDPHAGTAVTLAERWDGRRWIVLPTPNPNGSVQSELSAVSCASMRSCVAVGNTQPSKPPTVPLAEVWDGRTWAVTPVPNLANVDTSVLSGVSCTSGRSCVAVGESSPNFVTVTLAEMWNGRAWTIQPTPNESATITNRLLSVSCSARRACIAVGSTENFDGSHSPLAEVWDGTTWALQTIRGPLVHTTELLSVSCVSRRSCVAVGYFVPLGGSIALPFAEVWDGTVWGVEPTANQIAGFRYRLSVVSCTSRTACTAVGNVVNDTQTSQVTLAERRT